MARDKLTATPGDPAGVGSRPAQASASALTSRITTLLDLVGRREGGIGVREAERVTGIDRSAVSRLFRQLESVGWVQATDDRGTYTAGREFFAVAAAVRQRDSLWRAAAPLLESVTAQFNETTYLAVRRGFDVVFQDKVDCTQAIRYLRELNTPFPLTAGAAGRAILSALPDDEVDEALRAGLTAYTQRSITDPDQYQAQLGVDRELGYTYSQSTWVARGAGVACAYRDASGACVGAITLSAPIDRLTPEAATKVGPVVRQSAVELSRRIGYTGHS